MKITFLGGAGTVTGSKFLVEANGQQLLVDCGLFQGLKALRLRNWHSLPVDVGRLVGIVLSHAHIDHSGYLPVLLRGAFAGPIFATPATADLLRILLPDSGHLQEEDARYANEKHFSKHEPALPLYTEAEAVQAAARVKPLPYGNWQRIGDFEVRLQPAGHILGAATVEVRHGGCCVLFSGDLGRYDDLLMRPPTEPDAPDVVVMESTYGDRMHGDGDPVQALGDVVERVVRRQGIVLIPSFAVGRAQMMLYCLHRLFELGRIESVPVFVNSPMASDVTQLYRLYTEEHRMDPAECAFVCGSARFIASVKESKELNRREGPMVIISASGMLTGGRILHHLKQFAGDERNAIVLPGFQAAGTRGDALLRGARELKIHGRYVPIRAEVVHLDEFSAHADRDDLLRWLGAARRAPRQVYLVHGEPSSADALRRNISERLRLAAEVAELGETVEVNGRDGGQQIR